MATGTAAQMRAWTGPAILSFGFRPFFLGGAIWAAVAMILWVLMLSGQLTLPTRFDPVSWHVHEFLFGYLGAILAGFLLTAVPNWTGRLPVIGWRLCVLALVWLAGRGAIMLSADMPWGITAGIDLAFPLLLGLVILREIIAGRNWRNLVVLILLVVFTLANALFHLDAAQGRNPAQGIGLRLGLATAMMMIAVIGGRVVPSFTRNWLASNGYAARPAPPMQRFDKAVLLLTALVLLVWVLRPHGAATGLMLLATGVAHLWRLARWRGWLTGGEPLVWVLHAGYAFLPVGALAMGGAALMPDAFATASAQHIWMAGAIGLMTLAVSTRATLGHTGQKLHAGSGTVALYGLVIASVAARLASGIWPDLPFLEVAAICWIASFGGFALLYGPLLLRAKPTTV